MYDYEPSHPEPERYITTEQMPVYPISPDQLVTSVFTQLKAYNNVVPFKSEDMVSDLCKGFNQCIYLNKKGNTPLVYVFSPKTGSAKSLSAKMYVSMLKNESSLIVVAKVKDAISFCEDINRWSGNRNYARCTYQISDTNPDHQLRVDKKDLARHRCIVVSHSMFIKAHQQSGIESFKFYSEKSRDLIIIDERISLYERLSVNSSEVKEVFRILSLLQEVTGKNLSTSIDSLESVVTLVSDYNKIMKENKVKTVYSLSSKLDDKDSKVMNVDFTSAFMALDDKTINIAHIVSQITKRKSDQADDEVRADIRRLLNAIQYITKDSMIFHKSGTKSILMRTENILNQLGSCVILDATATVNEIYNTAVWHQSDNTKHVHTSSPREYGNFTIYKAIGHPQGRSSIYEGLSPDVIKTNAKKYLATAATLLTDKHDKLLIISHKTFMLALEAQSTGSNIVFTNWGNHVGKNDWSDCNKVMIIGWNYIPPIEHWGNHVNAVGSIDNACIDAATSNYDPNFIDTYETTQLADDLVQAISRCSVRKTISTDGNCAISEAYIYYPDNAKGKKVMELVECEFNGSNVVEWHPIAQASNKKLPKSKSNIQSVLDCLDHLSASCSDVNQARIADITGLSKSIISRAANDKDFLAGLQSRGYGITTQGKSKLFILK